MARYPAGPRGRKARNRMYTILAVLIIGIVFVYFYGPFGSGETETVSEGPPMNANPDFDFPVAGDVPVVGESTEVNEPLVQIDMETSSINGIDISGYTKM